MNYYGTEYNLELSKYIYELHNNDNIIKFYFSTENKLKKFSQRCEEFIENTNAKESLKNGFIINACELAYLLLYAKIENNGFLISINDRFVRWKNLCVEYRLRIKDS